MVKVCFRANGVISDLVRGLGSVGAEFVYKAVGCVLWIYPMVRVNAQWAVKV